MRHLKRGRSTSWRVFCFAWVSLLWAPAAVAQRGPVINAVANAASYQKGTVSPGEMVVLFGSFLGPTQLTRLQLDGSGKLSTNIGNVQVLFNGVPAPLIYASDAQTCVMVPYEVAGASSVQVVVNYQGLVSQPFTVAVAATAPGIFSANASGQGPAAAGNANGSVNSATNPAAPGSYVTFYLTGEGQLSVPGSDGTIAGGADQVGSQVTVTIGGIPAQVMYAGAAPGNTNGFAQINAVVLASLQTGGPLPLVVQVGSAASQSGLTVSVSGPSGPPIPTLPAAPTNLSAAAVSSTQVNLTWTNNAADATTIRTEFEPAGSNTFTDFGTAFTLTGTGVAGLLANTTYAFRVRAVNAQGYSSYSNIATVTTLPTTLQTKRTVVLIHGLGQGSSDMTRLNQDLSDPAYGIDQSRFVVESKFDWSTCAKLNVEQLPSLTCPSTCSIEEGAAELANHIAGLPPGHVILVGYSMGVVNTSRCPV